MNMRLLILLLLFTNQIIAAPCDQLFHHIATCKPYICWQTDTTFLLNPIKNTIFGEKDHLCYYERKSILMNKNNYCTFSTKSRAQLTTIIQSFSYERLQSNSSKALMSTETLLPIIDQITTQDCTTGSSPLNFFNAIDDF